jgi:hypothetical protein
MSLRKTNTPLWLSLLRRVMIYLGGVTFLLMFFTKANIKNFDFTLQCYLTTLVLLQVFIDSKYKKEKDIYKL